MSTLSQTERLRADILQFGISSGLGLFPVTFDWAQIAYIGSPLITPFWAAMNILGGLVGVMWIAAPIMCKCLTVVRNFKY